MALKLNKIIKGEKHTYPSEEVSCILVSPDKKKAWFGYVLNYIEKEEGNEIQWAVLTPEHLNEEENTHDWLRIDDFGELLFPCEEVEIEVGFWTYLAI